MSDAVKDKGGENDKSGSSDDGVNGVGAAASHFSTAG